MSLPNTTTPQALARHLIDRPLYDLPDAAWALGNCSRSTLYRLIDSGQLVRVRMGGKALITGQSLAGLIEKLNTQETMK